MLEVVPGLEHLAAVRVDQHRRAGRAHARAIREEADRIGQAATAGVVDEHDQVGLLVLGAVGGQAVAEVQALACGQRVQPGHRRLGRSDVVVQARHQVAEQGARVAGGVLADHHAFAEDRDAAPSLGVAVVVDAEVAATRVHQQAAVRVRPDQLFMPAVGHRRRGAPCGNQRAVLLLELGEVLLVEVGAAGGIGAGGGQRQHDGCRKQVDATLIHWWFP
jgi:hypothetical protein